MVATESQKAAYSHDSANSSKHNVVFCAWLVATYGLESLRSSASSGIADIAGGAGSLSFEMAVRYGVYSTCIDTRCAPTALKGIARRKMRKIHKSRLLARDSANAVSSSSSNSSCSGCSSSGSSIGTDKDPLMSFVRGAIADLPPDDFVFVPEVEACVGDVGTPAGSTDPTWGDSACGGAQETHGQTEATASQTQALPFQYIQASFPSARCEESIAAASLLCGMHADQCTELIVDEALRLRKPFAVVPCCIFKDLYPKLLQASGAGAGEKRSRDLFGANANTDADVEIETEWKKGQGLLVSTYSQFVDYLRCKHPRMRQAHLPFMGRNVVLYMTAEDWP